MCKYTVKDAVCDYGVFENNKLKLILNSRENALLICDILKADDNNKTFLEEIEEPLTEPKGVC